MGHFSGRRNKFHAVRTVCPAGHKHDSKVEASFCQYLHMRMIDTSPAAIRIVEIQVFPLVALPWGGRPWKLDFRVVWSDATAELYDVKGFPTPEFKLKRKAYEAMTGNKVQVVTSRAREFVADRPGNCLGLAVMPKKVKAPKKGKTLIDVWSSGGRSRSSFIPPQL